MELKARYLKNNEEVDYDEIVDAVLQGCEEKTDKGSEKIIGIDDIKKKYFEEWSTCDNASRMNYPEKMDIYFHDVLPNRMENKNWKVEGIEQKFEFVYDERVIVHGFIDRIDKDENGVIKVIDYKSSKKVFDDTKIKTPLQMVVYDLACLQMFNTLPEQHEYDFVLLDKKQTTEDGVCSKGYLKRGVKKLDKLLDKMIDLEKEGIYPPKPTPLCYWCPFPDKCHTPNADIKYSGMCPYYSLWKPNEKNFSVNQEFKPEEENKPKTKRKLVF